METSTNHRDYFGLEPEFSNEVMFLETLRVEKTLWRVKQ